MSRELEFDGWWQGKEVFFCDNCRAEEYFRFDDESVKETEHIRSVKASLKKSGWIFTQVNGHFKDFCCEACRNEYIRKNTI